ncbi:MAG: hypothetical protein U1F10_11310 [Burkholderiales bacterium]
MNKLWTALAVSLAVAATLPAHAQTGGAAVATAPGKAVIAETVKLTGTITAIDAKTRDVTLKGPQGNEVVVTAGPDVKNFAQLKVGDTVELQYVEALTLELKKGGGLVVGRSDKANAVGAKPGELPAGAVGRQVTVVADVIATDPAKQTITLKGPQRTVTMRIPDAEQFKRIAKGDQVEATYTQALAVAVEAAAPAKK